MNVIIWDQHATPGGIFWLFVCISGGIVYKQSPMRGLGKESLKDAPEADVEEQAKLLTSTSESSAAKRRG
jgi:hypothetical protein